MQWILIAAEDSINSSWLSMEPEANTIKLVAQVFELITFENELILLQYNFQLMKM